MTLAELRKVVSLTQEEVAQSCGVSKTTVSAWERGTAIPRLRHVRALAEALHTSIKDVQSAIEAQREASINATDARRKARAGTSISA